jgi:hypothetical protein
MNPPKYPTSEPSRSRISTADPTWSARARPPTFKHGGNKRMASISIKKGKQPQRPRVIGSHPYSTTSMGNIGVELNLKTVAQRWEGGCAGSGQDKRRARAGARRLGKQVESWRRRVGVDWGLTLPEMSAVFENRDGYGRSYIL